MNFIKRFWSIIFIFLVWFIFSFPYFFQNKVPYSSTYQVNHFFPWSGYEKFLGPVKNNAMPDVHSQIYPWKKFTIDTYKSGQIPLWNSNNFSGNPHLANFQSAVFSPFNLLFFVLPFIDAWSIMILLQPLLAAFFMYLMLRSFQISKEGSLIGAISFMFCGFMTVWMAYGTLFFAILYLPLSIYSVHRFIQSQNKKFLVLLGLTVPLSFFSGHFQISLYFLFALILFILFKIGENRKAFILLIPLTLGLILSLIQIIPSLRFYNESIRSSIFIITEVIPFKYLVTLFSPDYFGNPVTRNDWFGHYAEWASFIGVIPFIFVFFSNIKKKREVIFFILLGGLSLVLAVNSPIANIILSLKIPVISTSSFSRIIVLTSFSLTVLSAFGFDNFLNLIKNKAFKKVYLVSAVASSVAIFLSILPVLLGIPNDKISIAIKSLRSPALLLLIFFLFIFLRSKKEIKYFSLIFIILVSFQSLYFAIKWMPFDHKELVYPKMPIIEAMKKNTGDGRAFGNFGAEISSYYQIPSIEGYDPLYIGRYGELIRSADSGSLKEGERSVVRISRRGEFMNRAIDLLGVSLIFHPIADTNQNWAFPVWEDPKRFKLVYQDDKFQLFKNNTAMERVQLFYDYEVIKDNKEEIKRFYSPDFDFRKKLLLEEMPDVKISKGEGSSQIVLYSPTKIVIKTKTTTSAFLFLSDNYYPDWKAKVNGREAKVYRADYSFRAVIVPQGESSIEFSFVPGF